MSSGKNRGPGRRRDPIAEIASAQGGAVSLGQLRDAGVSTRNASHLATSGRLHRIHRGVYTVGHRSISQQTHLRAAVLACGEGAVVSHLTAAAFHGLWDKWPVLIDVTVPVEAGRKIDGIRCRRCRYPEPEEVEAVNGVAVTTVARTLVDLAGILTLKSLRKVVGRAVILKKLDPQAVDLAIDTATGRRGLKALQLALVPYREKDGKVPDVRSDFETLVLPDLIEAGLPRPGCNVWLHLDGERFLVDFFWDRGKVIVETDGRETHESPTAFQDDRRRDQVLAAAGYRVLRVTWDQLHGEREAVLRRVARALGVEVSPR
ncbi:MAG TPA: type IV toxin-antitoxin system AbiEi family antitoxin domain-containing protein [Solirubrobacterales bacterium]|nr:type IV toxin-antitoxin system AbiEi family antitoxin domain-containing protein [Solirubrobacterales bacterium]